jgi:primosomal protein N' (replication factor Y)
VALGNNCSPSLESIRNCQQKKYQLLRLNKKALTDKPLHYQLIDVRSLPLQQGLAAPTIQAIETHLQNNNQVLVFINRRGFAPVLLCHQCGWMLNCKACDAHLTVHKKNAHMICHHCGLTQGIPKICLRCKSHELVPVGTGTQRVQEYLSARFPDVSILRLDRDAIQKKQALNEHLDKINKGEAQLIVGTQMLAKGHHFPRLSLVVILDADVGLHHQDFRALEHLGQLLTQVSGRAGRAEHPGHILIQTHSPQHPLLNVLIQQGYDEFALQILDTRQQAQLPPYQYLALIRAQGKTQNKVLEFLHATKLQIQAHPITVMGPAPAPLARKAHHYRMQLLIKAPSRKVLKSALTQLREWLTINKQYNAVQWNVDIDPMDLS